MGYNQSIMRQKIESRALRAAAIVLVALLAACTSAAPPAAETETDPETDPAAETETAAGEASPFIVQGTDLAAVTAAVEEVGGAVTHELKIIRAVGARLTAAQRAALAEHPAVTRIYEDRKVGIDAES